MRSIAKTLVNFEPKTGDVVGVRKCIQGYGTQKWILVPSSWYGDDGPPKYPEKTTYSDGCSNRVYRYDGSATITKITKTRIFFD